MANVQERYLVDEHGERFAVVLTLEEYDKMVQELEELEDIRAYDAAKASGETPVPIEQALAEIEQTHSHK